MLIRIDLGERSYDIVIEGSCIKRAGELLDLDRRCLVVTDEGVPPEYAQRVASQCGSPFIATVPSGEGSKSLDMLEKLLLTMLEAGFTRGDCVVAVSGGMPGDLAGFAAATYMRGIDFYNIPTTLLSQADSSIGGKTAVNLGGVKNIAGAFWQPKGVLIDPELLGTLPERHRAAGLAEIIKAGLIGDAGLFGYIRDCRGSEGGSDNEGCLSGMDTEKILEAALKVKQAVIEADERESGLRRILNFGHTIGHGIESASGLLHGECVALGMTAMCSPEVRQELLPVLERAGLPLSADCDPEAVFEALMHDKKMKDGGISAVFVREPGRAEIETVDPEELKRRIEGICRPRNRHI